MIKWWNWKRFRKQVVQQHWEWKLTHFQALVVADCHGSLTQEELLNCLDGREPDVVFILGDNLEDDLELVKHCFKSRTADIFGIEGNHDFHGTLQEHGIKNLYGKVIDWNGIKIGGFSGSVRYKEINPTAINALLMVSCSEL